MHDRTNVWSRVSRVRVGSSFTPRTRGKRTLSFVHSIRSLKMPAHQRQLFSRRSLRICVMLTLRLTVFSVADPHHTTPLGCTCSTQIIVSGAQFATPFGRSAWDVEACGVPTCGAADILFGRLRDKYLFWPECISRAEDARVKEIDHVVSRYSGRGYH